MSESSKKAQIISILADNEDDKELSKIKAELAQKVKAISTKKATSAEDFLKRSKEFGNIGECALAIADLETAVKINPEFGAAYYEIGLNYLNMEDPEEAIKNFDKAISLKFNLSETYLERGLAYGKLNNFQKLAEDCSKSIEIDPKSAEAYQNRGWAFVELEENEKSIADSTKAIELQHDNAWAYNNRAYAHKNMREYKGAILDFSKAIAMDDTEETFFKNRAETYEEVHDYRNAMHDYETLIRKNPRVYSYRCDKANLLNKQGKTELALTELDEVLKITPGESSAYLTRAPIRLRKGDLRGYADGMIMGSTLRSLDDSAH